jgi:hypothetical protein
MIKVGLIMAGLALVFGGLAIRDIRAGNAGFVVAMLRKSEHPMPFWGLVIAEILGALLSAILAVAALTMSATCDDKGPCSVVIATVEPTS